MFPKQGKAPGGACSSAPAVFFGCIARHVLTDPRAGPVLVDSEGGDAQYRTLFALWLCSYDEDHVRTLGGGGTGNVPVSCANGLAIQNLIKILRHTKKTRIVRVAIMCLKVSMPGHLRQNLPCFCCCTASVLEFGFWVLTTG